MPRALLPALAALLLGGCIFSSSNNRLNVLVQYEIIEEPRTTPPDIVMGFGSVQVIDGFETPGDCFNFASRASQEGPVIELIIERTQTPGCTGESTAWAYKAIITGLSEEATRIGLSYGVAGQLVRKEYQLPAAPVD